ncbi:golgin subfamily A [Trichuris trichiura]|uniref:Golgin subfamily A n=1 Tax=Trichuris trichiura TaxID=36087 RepID=A0A077ZKG7_TRITR|nr:golgin subfamily A [Trichuris trichiura]
MVDEKSKLQSQLRQAMDLANAQKQENVLTEQELKTTVHSLEISQAELRRAQEELGLLQSRTGQLEEQLTRKESEVTELDRLYRSAAEEKRELRCKLNVLAMEHAKAEETANSLKARISLQNGYRQTSSDDCNFSGDASSEEKRLAEVEEKFLLAEDEKRRLIEEMDQLKSENAYLRSLRDSEVRELRETIQILQNEKDSILLSRRELETEIQRLSSAVNEMRSVEREQNAKSAVDNGGAEESHCSAEVVEAMRQQNAEMDRLREALLAKETQLNSLAYEVQENSQCAQDFRAVLQQLHDERATSARAVSQNVLLKGQLLELEEKFVEMSNANAELASQLESANRVLAHHSADGCAVSGGANGRRTNLNSNCVNDDTHLLIDRGGAVSKHHSEKGQDNPMASPQGAPRQSDGRKGNASDVGALNNVEDSVLEPEFSSTHSDSRVPALDGTKDESCTEAGMSTMNDSEDDSRSNAIESLKNHIKELQESFNKALADNAELVSRNERLDHLVIQLQGETETIGEFITLYRHQRQVIQQRLCEKEEYTAHVCREKELMKEKVAQLRNLFTELLLEVGVLKNYALPAPSARKPFQTKQSQSEQSDADQNSAISAEMISEKTLQEPPPNKSAIEEPIEETDGFSNAYSLAERMNSLLMELQKPELSNNMPPRDPQLHCKQCIGRMITL